MEQEATGCFRSHCVTVARLEGNACLIPDSAEARDRTARLRSLLTSTTHQERTQLIRRNLIGSPNHIHPVSLQPYQSHLQNLAPDLAHPTPLSTGQASVTAHLDTAQVGMAFHLSTNPLLTHPVSANLSLPPPSNGLSETFLFPKASLPAFCDLTPD